MADEQQREPSLAPELTKQGEDLPLDRDVESRRRLIAQKHGWIARERHRDHHALTLTTR